MNFPANFVFSQSSLQSYQNCPRQFLLRYIQRLSWPAQDTSAAREFEAHLRRGNRFHNLIHQYFENIPIEKIEQIAAADPSPEIWEWWQKFRAYASDTIKGTCLPEFSLQTTIAGQFLMAKFDLISIIDGKVIIYDWKTNLNPINPITIKGNLQSKVYPYVICKEFQSLNITPSLAPENISLVYWQANSPHSPVTINYTADNFKRDEDSIATLIERITQSTEDDFFKTDESRRCALCAYRSYCERGIEAGPLSEMDYLLDDVSLDNLKIDLDSIEELSF